MDWTSFPPRALCAIHSYEVGTYAAALDCSHAHEHTLNTRHTHTHTYDNYGKNEIFMSPIIPMHRHNRQIFNLSFATSRRAA